MDFLNKVANFFAKYSTARWNQCRVLRKVCRTAYRGMGEIYLRMRDLPSLGLSRLSSRNRINLEDEESFVCDYPWPYCLIAPWEETDDSLISDPSGFVIRRSASYCAWKIRQETGK